MLNKKTILLVDDDDDMHTICKKYVELNGYNFTSAACGKEGLEQIVKSKIDLIVLDYMMREMNGYQFYKTLINDEKYKNYVDTPVIILTILSEDTINKAELLSMGITFVLQKPFGNKELMSIIDNILIKRDIKLKQDDLEEKKTVETEKLAIENKKLKEQIQETYRFDNIIAISKPMRNIISKITKVAKSDANILIYGESGTGKELIARCIHENSKRRENAFLAVDCSALPAHLLESELFGYEAAAFTGVTQYHSGLIELAHGGTLFIDDIDELSEDLQIRLLKVLQNRQLTRLGSDKAIDVNIRIISATNKTKLADKLHHGLYYRINVAPIHLPPLRERNEDILLLANHFLKKYCKIHNKKLMRFSAEAISCLQNYHWPRNVREMEILIERIVSVNKKVIISLQDLSLDLQENYELQTTIHSSILPLKEARRKWAEKFEKSYLLNLLAQCNGNISKVAKLAQVNRMTIYRMMNSYNISPKKSMINRN